MKPQVVVIVGQIASGKTTLARYLESAGFERVVTYTTRPPRAGEKDGKDYHFIGEEDFWYKKDTLFFAEHTEYNANFGYVYYGTSKESLETPGGIQKVIVLNPRGVMALKAAGYDILVVHLDFDRDTLLRRALNRGDNPDEIRRRIADDAYLFRLLNTGNFVDIRITDPELKPYEIAATIRDYL